MPRSQLAKLGRLLGGAYGEAFCTLSEKSEMLNSRVVPDPDSGEEEVDVDGAV